MTDPSPLHGYSKKQIVILRALSVLIGLLGGAFVVFMALFLYRVIPHGGF